MRDVVDAGARVTLAVDSEATVAAAADGGVQEVLVDVNAAKDALEVQAVQAPR